MAKQENKIKTYLFLPRKGQSMFTDYPELKDYEEFKDLKPMELAFAWWYGSPTSDFRFIESESDKREKCFIEAFGTNYDKAKFDNWIYGSLPPHVALAAKKFASFNPSVRLISRQMDHDIHRRYQLLIDYSDDEIKAMAVDERRQAAQLMGIVSKDLPEVVKRIEFAYGLKEQRAVHNESTDSSLMGSVIDDRGS